MADEAKPMLGLWGWLVLVGLGLVALARIISLTTNLGDLDGEDVAPVLFSSLGSILASLALACAGLFQRSASLGIRVALLLGGCYFLLAGGDLASLLSIFSRFP